MYEIREQSFLPPFIHYWVYKNEKLLISARVNYKALTTEIMFEAGEMMLLDFIFKPELETIERDLERIMLLK